MSDKNHKFAIEMLHYHGFLTRSDKTTQHIGHDTTVDIGRSDIQASIHGKSVNIEVKRGELRFDVRKWTEAQRRWAKWSERYPFETEYYLFFTMGKDNPNYNSTKYNPRRSWLIPLDDVINVFDNVQKFQNSIPYNITKGINKNIKERKLSAIEQFYNYELTWAPDKSLTRPTWFTNHGTPYGGFWILPNSHIFYRKYCLDEK